MRGIGTVAVGKPRLTPSNSYKSVTVSMAINAQLARSIDGDLLRLSFINIW